MKCKMCEIELDENNRVKGRQWCRSCKNDYQIANYSSYQKKYQKKYLKNPKKRKMINKNRKKRFNTDPLFRLSCNVRCMIRKGIKNKGKKTIEIIGCSFEFLLKHLIKTAIKNYGSYDENIRYEVDHIIPLSIAKSQGMIILLNHYKNLQFLTREDNLKKRKLDNKTFANYYKLLEK